MPHHLSVGKAEQDSLFPPEWLREVRPYSDRRLDRLHQLNPKKGSTLREGGARIIPALQIPLFQIKEA